MATARKKQTKRTTRELPERLWRVPIHVPYLQPPLTDAALARAEKKLGVKLPRAYVAALRQQNGGYLHRHMHPSDHAPLSAVAGIGPRYPTLLGHDWEDVKEYMAEEGHKKPARIDDLIPFSGDGHCYYCLDYRKDGRRREPRVTFIDVECFEVDHVLAPDFATFLRQLEPDVCVPAWGLVTEDPPRTVAAALSKATRYDFKNMGDEFYGYPMYRAKLPGRTTWAWLTPNRVRRGHLPETTLRPKWLAKLLHEHVLRFPEHADCGWLLTCSDPAGKAGQTLAQRLAKLPFPSRVVRLEDP